MKAEMMLYYFAGAIVIVIRYSNLKKFIVSDW